MCDRDQNDLCLEIPLVSLTRSRMTSVSLRKLGMTPLTDQELDAVTIVFHQYETGLREGTIYTKVGFVVELSMILCKVSQCPERAPYSSN